MTLLGAGGLRLLILGLAVMAAGSVARASGSVGKGASQPTDLEDIRTVAHWVLGLQYVDAALPSHGAVKLHHTPGLVAPHGDPYFRVVPYRANLGVRGLLR